MGKHTRTIITNALNVSGTRVQGISPILGLTFIPGACLQEKCQCAATDSSSVLHFTLLISVYTATNMQVVHRYQLEMEISLNHFSQTLQGHQGLNVLYR